MKGEAPAVDLDIAGRVSDVSDAIDAANLEDITNPMLKDIFTDVSKESKKGKKSKKSNDEAKYASALPYERITRLLNYIQPSKEK
jgi:hypothetical protein